MANIEIEAVDKRYGPVQTLHAVSASVPAGAFVVLVGPSGCGKSTLLRMIAGLEEIDGGTISIDGQIINDIEPKHRDIAMVFQNYALYPHMTIAENMGFSLRLAQRPKPEIASRVADAAAILGLGDYLDRYPKQLSGGQRQRVAMGRAIVRDPKVFLFDEPLSNLDAKLRVQMRAELRTLHARLGTTIVYVTHDQIEAMTMADRIVVMRDGRVEQIGTPLEVYDSPVNRFVAGFIGSPSMNLLSGTLDGGADEARFVTGDGQALTLGSRASSLIPPATVELGVRPENLYLAADAATPGIDVTVTLIEPTGAETYVNAELAGEPIVAVLRERLSVAPGTTVRLGLEPGTAHLFDAGSGAAIAR